jgi:hypothetical protein
VKAEWFITISRSPRFEVARVLVRFNHVARFIENADHRKTE